MTDVLAGPGRGDRPPGSRFGGARSASQRPANRRGRRVERATRAGLEGVRRPLPVEAALAALAALLIALVPVELVVLIAWAGDGHSSARVGTVVQLGAALLTLADGVPLHLARGEFTLAPLGLTALSVVLLIRAGSGLARREGVPAPGGPDRHSARLGGRLGGRWRDRQSRGQVPGRELAGTSSRPVGRTVLNLRQIGTAVGSLAVAYAVGLTVLAGLAGRPGATPSVAWAPVCGLVVGGAGGLLGILRSTGAGVLLDRLPDRPRAAVAGGGAMAAGLLAVAAFLGAAAVGTHVQAMDRLQHLIAPGAAGGVALGLLDAVAVPNAALGTVGMLAGPGFAVGAGTSVTVQAARLGPVPALPLLAALPHAGVLRPVVALLLVAPPLCGVLGGVLLLRRRRGRTASAAGLWYREAGWAALAGATGALLLAAGVASAGGSAGPGRLAAVGASAWRVGAALLAEFALPAAAVAAAAAWWHRRSAAAP